MRDPGRGRGPALSAWRLSERGPPLRRAVSLEVAGAPGCGDRLRLGAVDAVEVVGGRQGALPGAGVAVVDLKYVVRVLPDLQRAPAQYAPQALGQAWREPHWLLGGLFSPAPWAGAGACGATPLRRNSPHGHGCCGRHCDRRDQRILTTGRRTVPERQGSARPCDRTVRACRSVGGIDEQHGGTGATRLVLHELPQVGERQECSATRRDLRAVLGCGVRQGDPRP
jgi:hypothetical protein